MDNIRKCQHCLVEFKDINGKVFSNHVRWCEKNPKRNDGNDNISKAALSHYDSELGLVKEFEVVCNKCKRVFSVKEREKQFPKRDKYYCSRSCGNSHDIAIQTRAKISKALKGRQVTRKGRTIQREQRVCFSCNKCFETTKKSDRKFCNVQCLTEYKRKDLNERGKYRRDCNFRFNVYHYPHEFDLDLIKKYGWYKAKNFGDNLEGVSRDHRISIDYGWKNSIPSELIRHPANCQLIKNRDNQKKNVKCSLQLEQLLQSIKVWNEKYGVADGSDLRLASAEKEFDFPLLQ